MERRQGWQALEETVRAVRGYAAKEARARFEVAKAGMYEIGAVNMMRAIAPLLPGFTLSVTEDFDQAGRDRISS